MARLFRLRGISRLVFLARPLPYLQDLKEKLLGPRIVASEAAQPAQIIQHAGIIGVVLADGLFLDFQGLQVAAVRPARSAPCAAYSEARSLSTSA